MNRALVVFSLFFLVNISTYGQVDEEYSKTLKKMFEVSGSEESYKAVIKQMFPMLKGQYSNVEADVWNDLEKEFLKTSLDNLTEMLAPVYSSHLTIEELKEIIKFYESPVGKKFAAETPSIMQESMQVGQQWGMKIGQDFAEKMKERGY